MEANSTGGQGSRRAVAPSDDDDCTLDIICNHLYLKTHGMRQDDTNYGLCSMSKTAYVIKVK